MDARRCVRSTPWDRHPRDAARRRARGPRPASSSATRSRAAGWSSRPTSTTRRSSRWRSASRRACKINANIGNSPTTVVARRGAREAARCVAALGRRHGHGPLDRQRHRRDPRRRSSTPPPCRSAPCRSTRRWSGVKHAEDLTTSGCSTMVEHQAQQGVDYMTIHAGVLLEHLPLCQHRVTGHRLPRRRADGALDGRTTSREPALHALRRAPRDLPRATTSRSRSATACGPAASPTPTTPPSSPS